MLYNITNMKCGLVSGNKNKQCLSILSTYHSTILPSVRWKLCSSGAARGRKEAANCFLMLEVNNGNKKKTSHRPNIIPADVAFYCLLPGLSPRSSVMKTSFYDFVDRREKTCSGAETGRRTLAPLFYEL